jgi:hypothetical protein
VSAVRQQLVVLEVVELVTCPAEIAVQSTWAQPAARARDQKVVTVQPQLGLQPEVVEHQQRGQTTSASIPAPVVMDKK